jgi:hypothetical protein
MAVLEPMIRGKLASHPEASAFAAEVLRVHRRYATEIVQRFALCPFTRDVDVAFGKFCVMLDREPDHEATRAAVLEANNPVLHVVFPLVGGASNLFERFASALMASLREAFEDPPVMAAFHPELVGDREQPYRLIGILRRAPDPFVQLIPGGLHEGGTVFAASIEDYESSGEDRAEANFKKLSGAPLDELLQIAVDIRADRERSYVKYPELAVPRSQRQD